MMLKKLMSGAVLCALLTTGAQANCWTPEAMDGAKVRNLQSHLMVAALRCDKSQFDVLSQYNGFVNSKKHLIQMGNHRLKTHFAKTGNAREAQQNYDRFAVALANRYGAGSGDLSECREMQQVAQTIADSPDSFTSLVAMANQYAPALNFDGQRCGAIVIASRTP